MKRRDNPSGALCSAVITGAIRDGDWAFLADRRRVELFCAIAELPEVDIAEKICKNAVKRKMISDEEAELLLAKYSYKE